MRGSRVASTVVTLLSAASAVSIPQETEWLASYSGDGLASTLSHAEVRDQGVEAPDSLVNGGLNDTMSNATTVEHKGGGRGGSSSRGGGGGGATSGSDLTLPNALTATMAALSVAIITTTS